MMSRRRRTFPRLESGYYGGDLEALEQDVVEEAEEAALDALEDAGLGSDGVAPDAPTDVTVLGGQGILFIKWTPVTNSSPVTYDVHLSTTSGFTPSASTLLYENVQGGLVSARHDATEAELAYGTTYYAVVISRDIDGDSAASTEASGEMNQTAAGDIVVGTITAELLQSTFVVSNTLTTAESGQRVIIDTNGIELKASDNSTIVYIPTDADASAVFNGELTAETLNIQGTASLADVLQVLTNGGYISLKSAIADPDTAPTVSQTVPSDDFYTAGTDTNSSRRGLWWDGTYFVYLNGNYGTTHTLYRVTTAGALQDATTVDLTGFAGYVWNMVKIGSYWYGLGIVAGAAKRLTWADSGGVPSGAPTIATWSEWNGVYGAAVATDGTDLYVVQSNTTPIGGTSALDFEYYTVSGTTWTWSSGWQSSNTGFASLPDAYYLGSGDLGSTRHIVHCQSMAYTYSYDGTGSRTASHSWELDDSSEAGLVYYNSSFYTLSTSTRKLKRYSAWGKTDGVGTTKYYFAYTWNDNDGTTHESGLSPRKASNLYARRTITVTWPTIPDNGGADDPNSVNIYAKQNASDPGTTFSSYYEQSMNQTGTSKTLTAYATSTTGTQDTSFASISATAGYITAQTGSLKIGGDGELTLPQGAGTAPKTGAEAMAYFDTTDDALYVHNGTNWRPVQAFMGGQVMKGSNEANFNATYNPVQFSAGNDTTNFDPMSAWDATSDYWTLSTALTRAGIYRFTAHVTWDNPTTNHTQRKIRFRDPSGGVTIAESFIVVSNTTAPESHELSCLYYYSGSGTVNIRLDAYSADTAGAAGYRVLGGGQETWFSIEYLGPKVAL